MLEIMAITNIIFFSKGFFIVIYNLFLLLVQGDLGRKLIQTILQSHRWQMNKTNATIRKEIVAVYISVFTEIIYAVSIYESAYIGFVIPCLQIVKI